LSIIVPVFVRHYRWLLTTGSRRSGQQSRIILMDSAYFDRNRHGLKILWPRGRAGSIPAAGTNWVPGFEGGIPSSREKGRAAPRPRRAVAAELEQIKNNNDTVYVPDGCASRFD
jgi:hypothetical protein